MKAAKLKAGKLARSGAGFVVGRHAEQHSLYRSASVYVPPSESNDNSGYFKVSQNADTGLMDFWLVPEEGFDGRHVRQAHRCRDLWSLMPRPSWRQAEAENARHARAATALQKMKRSVRRDEWEIFENAMRWNEPGGYLGSHYAAPKAANIAATKATVRRVLEAIAR